MTKVSRTWGVNRFAKSLVDKIRGWERGSMNEIPLRELRSCRWQPGWSRSASPAVLFAPCSGRLSCPAFHSTLRDSAPARWHVSISALNLSAFVTASCDPFVRRVLERKGCQNTLDYRVPITGQTSRPHSPLNPVASGLAPEAWEMPQRKSSICGRRRQSDSAGGSHSGHPSTEIGKQKPPLSRFLAILLRIRLAIDSKRENLQLEDELLPWF